ncbi:MAG: PIN domain-containing protein [Acidimicrobiales bacterium]
MSVERTFVDTNILVYAYDSDAADKHAAAKSVLTDLWNSRYGVLSSQVLQEFYVTVTRKIASPMTEVAARDVITTYRAWQIHRPDVDDIVAASDLAEHHHLSFWDALIVVSAQRLGAAVLYSEDLQRGIRYGPVTISNPLT